MSEPSNWLPDFDPAALTDPPPGPHRSLTVAVTDGGVPERIVLTLHEGAPPVPMRLASSAPTRDGVSAVYVEEPE